MAGAPALFKTAVQAAVQFFQTTFTNNITINIDLGWGEVQNQALDTGAIGETRPSPNYVYSYSTVRNALINADFTSATVGGAVQALPTIDPTGGAKFTMTSAEAKALGLIYSTSTVDGYIGLSSAVAWTFDPSQRAVAGLYDGIGVLEHEIAHLLGRTAYTGQQSNGVSYDTPLDLFRFSAAHAHTFLAGPGYFSLDDGVTSLKAFNDGTNGADGDDWASSTLIDSFDARATRGAKLDVSDVDVHEMEVLGYKVAANAAVFGNPTVGPGVGGTPTGGNGTLTGTTGDDWLQGGAGNDTLHGGMGSDYLDGGLGLNTATYDGASRQYTVTTGATEVVKGGPESGTDFLVNIQRIQFVDGYLATGTADTAGQVYRIYEATLGRAPDPVGLANWVHSLNAGASLQSVVNGFVGSTEFQQIYGALDNTSFVTLLYHNVLHRDPDAPGLGNWVGQLNAGTSRAQVVLGFSESAEDVNALAVPVQQGLWIQDTAAAETARLYDAVFGRLPDISGLTNWTHMLESGTSLQTVANGFVGSTEFQAAYGSLDNTSFVTLLYSNVLHRTPDPAGLNGWVSQLSAGASRAQVVLGFSESPEHIANTAPHVDAGIWLA